jgi:hypothetical protein
MVACVGNGVCVVGGVACVGSGPGGAVVGASVAVDVTDGAGTVAVVEVDSAVIRGIVSSGDASRDSAQAPTAIVAARAISAPRSRRRTSALR